MEIWRKIENHESYEISRTGKVRSHKFNKVKLLKGNKTEFGHLQVNLDGELHYIHRLVGFYFVPNPLNLPHINHKDRNPANNDADNLEWSTVRENITHGYKGKKETIGAYLMPGSRKKPWRAHIRANNKRMHLGYFKTEQEAVDAYKAALESLSLENKYA